MKPLELASGLYSICPLCMEHIRWPDLPVGFYDTEAALQNHYATLEATLTEHLVAHTAEVMLCDDD